MTDHTSTEALRRIRKAADAILAPLTAEYGRLMDRRKEGRPTDRTFYAPHKRDGGAAFKADQQGCQQMTVTLSLHAELERPIPRVRSDREWVELERSAALKPLWHEVASVAGFVLFLAVVIWGLR